MSGNSCVFGCCAGHGEDREQLKVDVVLYAPDVLPQHCCVQHLDVPRAQADGSRRTPTILKPLHGASVTHNGVQLQGEAELFPGDLIGLGQHYLFMFKDPTAPDVQRIPTWMTSLSPPASASSCNACGSYVRRHRTSRRVPACWRDLNERVLSLTYELHQEDQVLEKILTMVDPSGPEPKLIPAFLLCLCIQHSAASWEMTNFRKLLLQIANQIQLAMLVSANLESIRKITNLILYICFVLQVLGSWQGINSTQLVMSWIKYLAHHRRTVNEILLSISLTGEDKRACSPSVRQVRAFLFHFFAPFLIMASPTSTKPLFNFKHILSECAPGINQSATEPFLNFNHFTPYCSWREESSSQMEASKKQLYDGFMI